MAVSVLLAGVLLWYVLKDVKFYALVEALKKSDIRWVFLAAGIGFLNLIFRGLRWKLLLTPRSRPDNEKEIIIPGALVTTASNMIGYLGNNFLPARAGEVLRCVYLGRHTGISRTFAFTTAIIERVYDTVFLALALVVSLAFVPALPSWLNKAAYIMLPLALAVFLLFMILPWFENILLRIAAIIKHETIKKRLSEMLVSALNGLSVLKNPLHFLFYNGFTVIIWSLDVFLAVVVAWALNLQLPVLGLLLLLVALAFASAAPSTPGYLGIYQFVAVEILPLFGLTKEEALAYIFLLQGMMYLTVTVLGVPSLLWLSKKPLENNVGKKTE